MPALLFPVKRNRAASGDDGLLTMGGRDGRFALRRSGSQDGGAGDAGDGRVFSDEFPPVAGPVAGSRRHWPVSSAMGNRIAQMRAN